MSTEMNPKDAELVQQSLAGNRDAFGSIVERYQSLVCSLAYNSTGSLTESEDLAQETFLIAWRQLKQLREPEKLRAWLCSIARSVVSHNARRHRRDLVHNSVPMEDVGNVPSAQKLPSEGMVQSEEERMLWSALEQIPEVYREPLILFYREGRSVERMAEDLEISPEAARQRLTRGRKLLQAQVMAFVEGTLERTRPGKAFTIAVLAALPAWTLSSNAATLGGTAAAGTGAAKAAAALGISGAILGPILGVLGGWFGTKVSIEATESARERQFMIRYSKWVWALVIVFCAAVFALSFGSRGLWRAHPVVLASSSILLVVGYMVTLMWLVVWANKQQARIRAEERARKTAAQSASGDIAAAPKGWVRIARQMQSMSKPFEYRSQRQLFGLPLVHVLLGTGSTGKIRPAKGWIAIGDIAYGGLVGFGGAFAIAPVSLAGGGAVGLISGAGGFAGALLSLAGGLSFGVWALGGMAVGIMACGGCAVAWTAAQGGVAVAHHFALGGEVFARHANDTAARSYFEAHSFFRTALSWMRDLRVVSLIILIPVICFGFMFWRQNQERRNSSGLKL